MFRKFTQDEFLIKCQQVAHPNLDFSQAVYVKQSVKVKLSCKKHPENNFFMFPDKIYQGQTSCKKCQKERKLKLGREQSISQEEFLRRCQENAQPNLDFSKAIYVNNKTKVKLSCKVHLDQEFYMLPGVIYSGSTACTKCLGWVTTQEQFLAKCKQTANKNLDFSRAVYKSAEVKVEVSCKKHPGQVFYMKPWHIYRGQTSCKKCQKIMIDESAQRRALTQQQFLDKCKKVAHKNLDFSNAVYKNAKTKVVVSCKKHPKQRFKMHIEVIYRGYTSCKECSNAGTSQKEQDLADFTKNIYKGNIVLNDRTILSGKELDIYLPDKQLAIEFNGVYWHSSAYREPSYHYDKYKECQVKGIRLIQIWEDTWDSKQDVVKHFLRQELNTLPTVDVKDTTITTNLDTKTVKAFLNTYHLEGYAKYDYALALKHQSTKELLSVMTFTKTANKGELLLSRFATKTAIVGSFNALIDTAKENCVKGLYRAKNSSKVRCFIVYTNNETDTGENYLSSSWQKVTDVPIACQYLEVDTIIRITNSQFAKKAFKCYNSGGIKWRLQW